MKKGLKGRSLLDGEGFDRQSIKTVAKAHDEPKQANESTLSNKKMRATTISIHSSSTAKKSQNTRVQNKLNSLIDRIDLMPPNAKTELANDDEIPASERKPHALSDSEDELNIKIKVMTEEAKKNKAKKITLKMIEAKETRPPGRPVLSTEQ